MINIHVGRSKDSAQSIYLDEITANSVLNVARYEAFKQNKRLYVGDVRPAVFRKIDSAVKYGVPKWVQGAYIAPVYPEHTDMIILGYITFVERDNSDSSDTIGYEPFEVITIGQEERAGLVIATKLFERIIVAFNNQVNTGNQITEEQIETGFRTNGLHTYEVIRGEGQQVYPFTAIPDNVVGKMVELQTTTAKTKDFMLMTVSTEGADGHMVYIVPVYEGNRISNFFQVINVDGDIKIMPVDLATICKAGGIIPPTEGPTFESMSPTMESMTITDKNNLKYHPHVNLLMKQYGISATEAFGMMEAAIEENPFFLLEFMVPSSYKSHDEYVQALEANFNLACEATNMDLDKFCEALVYEDLYSKAKEIGGKIADASAKTRRKLVAAKKSVSAIAGPIMKSIKDITDGINASLKEDTREEVITGSAFSKLKNIFIRCVAPAAGVALVSGGALAIVTFLGTLAAHKSITKKTRGRIMQELQMELKMVREKIEDAKSAGDNENKYKLMRLENKIETQIEDVRERILGGN